MPVFSTTITFVNKTGESLHKVSNDDDDNNIPHGSWTTRPPQQVLAGQTVVWETESAGFITGTEGRVQYVTDTPGACDVYMHWDNPAGGGNSYEGNVSDTVYYKIISDGPGDGDTAVLTWIIDETSTTHDGIPDNWKNNGVDVNVGGGVTEHIDLKAMGAKVNKPDIFVQLDFMQDKTSATPHTHALSPEALSIVHNAFKQSPFSTTSGSVGINLHIDAGPDSIMDYDTGATWGALSKSRVLDEVTNLGTLDSSGNYDWTAFDNIKNAPGGFTSTGRSKIFHYCISAHQGATLKNSGFARGSTIWQGGSDFILALFPATSSTPSDMQQAGTLMHELGHNLNLKHGGVDAINNKPNYISVMNYLFQMEGVLRNTAPVKLCDYSNAAFLDLQEGSLQEMVGLGPNAYGTMTYRWSPGAGKFLAVSVPTPNTPIDWNDDGRALPGTVSADINGDGVGGDSSTLVAVNDWNIVRLKGGLIGSGSAATASVLSQVSPADEITKADLDLHLPLDTTPPNTTASIEPPPNAAGWNNGPVSVRLTATDDISGVARVEYTLDSSSVGNIPNGGSIPVQGDGTHTISYHAIDRSLNIEPDKSLTFQIDSTPPEASIQYDPYKHEIIVRGIDDLSGTYSGNVSPVSVLPAVWRVPGADISETRTYRIMDNAENWLNLTMQVRCQRNEYEFNIINPQYSNTAKGRKGSSLRNTIQFRRVMSGTCCCPSVPSKGCQCEKKGTNCVLATMQRISVSQGSSKETIRTTIQMDWDILHNETILSAFTGTGCDACNVDGKDGQNSYGNCECCSKDNKSSREKSSDILCLRACGFFPLIIRTVEGRLQLDLNDFNSHVENQSGSGNTAESMKSMLKKVGI